MHPSPLVAVALLLLAASALRAQTLPAVAATPAPVNFSAGSVTPATLDLSTTFYVPGVTGPIARFATVFGDYDVELLPAAAPNHVANFSAYVAAQAYDNTFFHRTATFDNLVISIIQGGGFRSVSNLAAITPLAPVALEYQLPNARGTLAAARTDNPNSATSQWYFNTADNSTTLGPLNDGFGYTVFGRVLGTGMTVVDTMAYLPRYNLDGGGVFGNVPLRDVLPNQTQLLLTNLVTINTVRLIPAYPANNDTPALLRFTATSDAPAVVDAAVNGSTLSLTPGAAGFATVTLTALDVRGNTTDLALPVTVFSTDRLIAWRQLNFATLASAGAAADTADPDGDGLPNFLEYALGYPPLVADSTAATSPGRAGASLTLTYPRIADPALTYTVEVASSPAGPWATLTASGNPSTGAQNLAGPVVITDPAPLADHPRRFLRLRVTR